MRWSKEPGSFDSNCEDAHPIPRARLCPTASLDRLERRARRCLSHDRVGASQRLKEDVLRTLPEHQSPQVLQLLVSLDNGEEVIACQLAHLAGEAGRPIRDEDLGFAEAARVEQDLARGRMAGVVLVAHTDLEIA